MSEYVVIARKYRPQTFTEVVGQEHIGRTISNAIKKNRLAHSFLFTGPSGVGKTTMARILAKALVCETGVTSTPCGVCEHCRMVVDSRHPDVYEMDAATNNSVDDVRLISERAGYSPSSARYRVFILDEVHMLSASAWNALLKILEEPPPHVFFIFATTEIDRVPATVQNRCQRYDFRSLELDQITARLAEVASKEKVEATPQLLSRIARAAGGGMRDAQTMLDQLIAVSDGKPTDDDLDVLLGAARGSDLAELTKAIIAEDAKNALLLLDRMLQGGVAPMMLSQQLAEHFRGLLLLSCCGRETPAVRRLGLAPECDEEAKKAGPDRLLRMCQVLIATQQSIRRGIEPRLSLEMTIVKLASLGALQNLDSIVKRLKALEGSGGPRPLQGR